MTKKELQATMTFLSTVKSAITELNWYGEDYDSPTMKALGGILEEATNRFRKEAKI